MEKSNLWLIVGLIIIACALLLRVATPRNRWVCVEGEWRAQGKPSSPAPQKACFNPNSVESEIEVLSSILKPPTASSTPTSTPVADSDSDKVLTVAEVELISPQAGELLTSPYKVQGRARGSWFFEATLPIVLKDAAGNILVETYGQAQGDWMTSDWVPFEADLVFSTSTEKMGELIIKKDNPSGLPENEAQVAYPVRLQP
jgi:hypothetical protein